MEAPAKKHSTIGASSCERWWNCPGSVALIGTMPKPTENSIYADEGTAMHELCDIYLSRGLPLVNDEFLETNIQVEQPNKTYREVEVTEEMLEAVEFYVDTIRDDMKRYRANIKQLKPECQVELQGVDELNEAFGTCDASLVIPFKKIIVYDAKYGKGVIVDVVGNKQAMYYALGVYQSLPEEERLDIEEVELVIVQPRAEEQVKRHTVSVTELQTFGFELRKRIQAVRVQQKLFANGATLDKLALSAGGHCRFCSAKPVCPAFKDRISAQGKKAFGDIDLHKPIKNLPKPTDMTPEQLSVALNNVDLLREWISAVLSYSHIMAEKGVKIPAYKLVNKRAHRKWVDETEVIQAYQQEFGGELFKSKLRSPSQMETLLGKGRKEELEKFIVKPEAGKVLVPASDNRPECVAGVVDAFKDVAL